MRSLVISLLILSSLAALTQSFSRGRFLVPFNLISQNDGKLAEDLVELIFNNQEKTWRGDIMS